jgi:hypothetical protein
MPPQQQGRRQQPRRRRRQPPMEPKVPPSAFLELGLSMMGSSSSRSGTKRKLRRFHSFFGVSPGTVSLIWEMLDRSGWSEKGSVRSPNPIHFLWSLRLLKSYNTEETHAAEAGVDEKTFRKWSWFYLEGIAKLCDYVVRSIVRPSRSDRSTDPFDRPVVLFDRPVVPLTRSPLSLFRSAGRTGSTATRGKGRSSPSTAPTVRSRSPSRSLLSGSVTRPEAPASGTSLRSASKLGILSLSSALSLVG